MAVSNPPAGLVLGGRFDAPFYPTLPETYTKGFVMDISNTETTLTWTVPFDIELLGIAVSCSKYELYDNWSLIYGGRYLVESCYTKDLPEGIHFMTCKYLEAGEKVIFKFTNTGDEKVVWFNFQCLRDAPDDETEETDESVE